MKILYTFQDFLLRRKKLTSLAIYAIMTMVPRGANAIIAIAYATILTPAALGIYGVCLAMQTILAFLLDGGISLAIIRTYYDHHTDKDAANAYIARMIVTSRATSLVTSLILLVAGFFVWAPLTAGQVPFWPYFPLVLLAGYLERGGELLANIARAMEKPKIFAAGDAVQALVLVSTAIGFVIVCKLGILGALLAIAAGSFSRTVVYSELLRRNEGVRWVPRLASLREFRDAVALGTPLVLSQISNWGRQMGQRVILIHVVKAAEVGAFFLASSIANILFVFVQAVSAVFDPLYYKRRIEGARGFREKVHKFTEVYFAMLAIIVFPCILFVDELNHLLFKNKYSGMGPVAAILLAASYVRLQQPLISKQLLFQKRTQWVFLTNLVPSLLTLILTPFVAPVGGLVAVSWLVLLAGLATMAGLGVAVSRHEKLDFPIRTATILLFEVCIVAFWVSLGAPFPGPGNTRIWAKVAVATVVMMVSFYTWIWRHRGFLRHITRG